MNITIQDINTMHVRQIFTDTKDSARKKKSGVNKRFNITSIVSFILNTRIDLLHFGRYVFLHAHI